DVRDGTLELRPAALAAQLAPGQCRLHIAGDDHHYARYDQGQTHAVAIVSGGGGAFLHPTETSRGKPGAPTTVMRTTSYPDPATSRALSATLVNPLIVMDAGLVHAAGALIAALLYWTIPTATADLAPAALWLGAIAVFFGSLYIANLVNWRIRKARKRLAKA